MISKIKVLKLGGSKAIVLPKELSKHLTIGKQYPFEIRLAINTTNADMVLPIEKEDIREYVCLQCNHRFHLNVLKEDVYCPACDNANLARIKEILEIK